MKNGKHIFAAVLAAAVLGAAAAQAGVVVVANPSVPGDAVSAGDLQSIFLGKTSSWSDGTAVKPAVLAGGPAAAEFLKSYVKKSPSQFSTFWKKAVFSGTGTPPDEFASDAELVKFVAATPGAVGFVADGSPTDGAKVLTVN